MATVRTTMYLLAFARLARLATALQRSCQFADHTPNLEWSGPSLAHGLVGDGSDTACEAWCCAESDCVAWSNLLDADCHLQPGERCCMGWPAGRTLTVPHDPSARCVSGRVDGEPPSPDPWPTNPGSTWQPTWDMAMSTVMMPCNTSGWFDPELAAMYGIADFDWSNARQMWANQAPMDDGARLITQAAMVKAVNPNTHVWIYRNLVKALSWYSAVGEKLADPAYAGWFLRFRDGVRGSSNYSSNPCTVQGDPPASGGGQPTMIQEPNTNCLPGSGCAILGNASTMCPNVGTTETAAICSRACEADPGCGAFTWHAPHAPNPLTWQKQCFLIKRTLPMMKCYPEPLHDSGVKGYGSICSPLYHSQDQTPEHMTGRKECIKDCDCNGVPCGEYIWDHRNASLREWLVNEHVMGASSGGTDGMANPNVTGFYFDDYWSESGEGWSHGPSGLPPPTRPNLNDCKTGPSEIQSDCLKDMGLTNQDVLDLNAGWRKTTASAMRAVAKAGGWVWQMFSGLSAPADSGPTCAVGYHRACAKLRTDMNRMDLRLKDPHAPGSVLDAASDVARFLLLRGTHSFLGTAWVGCEPDNGVEGGGHNQTYLRPKEFDIDYGVPQGLCKEDPAKPGRFLREFTKATAVHDCSTGASSVTMK